MGPSDETVTSGSTGEPVTVRKTHVTRLFWAACTIRDHLWHGRDFAGGLVVIRPAIPDAEMEDWGFPVADVYATGPALAMPGTVGLDEQVRRIDRFRPRAPPLLSEQPEGARRRVDGAAGGPAAEPPSPAHGRRPPLARPARAPHERSSACRSRTTTRRRRPASSPCSARRATRTTRWPSRCSSRCSTPNDRPCAEGEVGRVVVTDLHNFASPLVRYDIGDYAEVGGPCRCGRTLPTLRRVLGRKRNLLMKADGSRFLPRAGFESFAKIAPVLQYQVVQHALDEIEFKLVTAEPLTPAQEDAFAAVLREALVFAGRIRITQLRERLPGSVAGKFEDFVCKLDTA